jgi:hypothetical protein
MITAFAFLIILALVGAQNTTELPYTLHKTLMLPMHDFLIDNENNIAIASNNVLYTIDLNGSFVSKVVMYNTSMHALSLSLLSDNVLASLWSDNFIYLFYPNYLEISYSAPANSRSIHTYRGMLLVVSYPNITCSTLSFLDPGTGNLLNSYELSVIIADVTADEDYLYFVNIPLFGQQTYIFIASETSIVKSIDTQRRDPILGLTVDNTQIITAGHGLDIYDLQTGHSMKYMKSRWVTSPVIYQDSIGMLGFDDLVPVIPFIATDGTVLYTLVFGHRQMEAGWNKLALTANGDLVAALDDVLKIYLRC